MIEEVFRCDDLFTVSGGMMAAQVHTYAKMCEIVHLKYVQL